MRILLCLTIFIATTLFPSAPAWSAESVEVTKALSHIEDVLYRTHLWLLSIPNQTHDHQQSEYTIKYDAKYRGFVMNFPDSDDYFVNLSNISTVTVESEDGGVTGPILSINFECLKHNCVRFPVVWNNGYTDGNGDWHDPFHQGYGDPEKNDWLIFYGEKVYELADAIRNAVQAIQQQKGRSK